MFCNGKGNSPHRNPHAYLKKIFGKFCCILLNRRAWKKPGGFCARDRGHGLPEYGGVYSMKNVIPVSPFADMYLVFIHLRAALKKNQIHSSPEKGKARQR